MDQCGSDKIIFTQYSLKHNHFQRMSVQGVNLNVKNIIIINNIIYENYSCLYTYPLNVYVLKIFRHFRRRLAVSSIHLLGLIFLLNTSLKSSMCEQFPVKVHQDLNVFLSCCRPRVPKASSKNS